MNVVNTNISALRATNASVAAGKMLGTAMERLSTGKRINSAADDAAGLAISTAMTAQIRGMQQGIRNANDGISLTQTAQGALNEVTNMLQRIRELAVQAGSDTYSTADRDNIQLEVDALTAQIGQVLANTTFNGVALFDGTVTTVAILAGSNSADSIDLTLDDLVGTLNSGAGTPGTFDVTGPDGTNAQAALADIDEDIEALSATLARLGAGESRLQSAAANLINVSTSLSEARSRIMDTDYSAETTALAKAQILSQASTAMLAQANQSQQNVLSLLR
jgi:flagellin